MEPSITALAPYAPRYVARKSWFKVVGQTFRLFDTGGGLRFYVKQKAFKLREEITVYGDEGGQTPCLRIRARQVLDVSATYDVTDARSGESAGALRRKGLRSILRDEWAILGDGDQEIGTVREDSPFMALLRRFLSNLIPQHYVVEVGGEVVGDIKQRFNPFVLTYDVDLTAAQGRLDARIGVAMVVLLLAVEGRQG